MTVARKYKIKTRKKSKTVFYHKKKIFKGKHYSYGNQREVFCNWTKPTVPSIKDTSGPD